MSASVSFVPKSMLMVRAASQQQHGRAVKRFFEPSTPTLHVFGQSYDNCPVNRNAGGACPES
eukprot:8487147-Alexandrium_andersonii.AAC.1